MKINFDLKFVEDVTKADFNNIKEYLSFFCQLPLQAQIGIFNLTNIIEEEDEHAFFQQNYKKDKIGEYRFSLFITTIERYKNFIQNPSESNYKKLLLEKINKMKDQ